jgi:hypothetical protein
MADDITKDANVAALIRHADGERTKHEHQLKLLLAAPCVPPGASWFDACEDELEAIARYKSDISILQTI